MKSNILIFVIGFAVALSGGYFIFGDSASTNEQVQQSATDEVEVQDEAESADEASEESTTIAAEARILAQKGCISCHAVEGLDLDGPSTGPDLSNAYNEVKAKHGKSLEEYLNEPTTAVMASFVADNPLTDEEIQAITEALILASEE
ncbi:cytochrome c [Bacillus shivajii]|uniref:c-type cytochrome n=1 Tax=Bacillus shivajii TaxID=1983719 RepID=UPI001CFBC379|nr:cytochrome c [Bacillus shivajii]UCZ54047.1 cytochrome c [Bacillus shivajii]